MTTQAIRNPKTDHLLTAENAALILIDFQPGLVDGTNSIRREALVNNVVALAKTAKLFEMPVILSTIAVEAGYQEPTIPELIEVLPNVTPIDRTAVNAWEQPEFRAAVEALGRRKLIIAGLYGPRYASSSRRWTSSKKAMKCTPFLTRLVAPA